MIDAGSRRSALNVALRPTMNPVCADWNIFWGSVPNTVSTMYSSPISTGAMRLRLPQFQESFCWRILGRAKLMQTPSASMQQNLLLS